MISTLAVRPLPFDSRLNEILNVCATAITNVGIVATVGNILMGGFGFIFFSLTFLPVTRHIANRTAKLQAYLLSFSSVWVLACMIPYMVFFMNDSANVKAFIGQIQLPAAMVAATAAKSGHSTEYQTMWYCEFFLISSTLPLHSISMPRSSAPPRDLPLALHRFWPHRCRRPFQGCSCYREAPVRRCCWHGCQLKRERLARGEGLNYFPKSLDLGYPQSPSRYDFMAPHAVSLPPLCVSECCHRLVSRITLMFNTLTHEPRLHLVNLILNLQ